MKPILCTMCCIMLVCTSCVTSVQPLVPPSQMITEPQITGVWNENGNDIVIEPFQSSKLNTEWQKILSKDESKSARDASKDKLYLMSYKKKERTYFMILSLIRINENLYCDLYPAEVKDPADSEAGLGQDKEFLPGYTIARIAIKDRSSLTVDFLDGTLIRKQVLAGNMRLKHEYDPLFGTFVITASSGEMQQFLGKYGKDERFFPSDNSITLKRKG